MNTYDPADYIVYVSMDKGHTPSVVGGPSDAMESLPEGYANASPKTRLRRGAAQPSRLDRPAPAQPVPATLAQLAR